VYKPTTGESKGLYRVPSSREDVFADDFISMKSKRTLMRFLRHLQSQLKQEAEEGDGSVVEDEDLAKPFSEYLTSKFQVPPELYDALSSLSLSQVAPLATAARYAIPRLQRHLASIGVFGPGFGSVLVKWGGGSEISQVGCRALAVGGGVYVLNSGVESLKHDEQPGEDSRIQMHLTSGETITSKYVVGSNWDLPAESGLPCDYDRVSRSITIVSSSLDGLFPITAEGGPIPAGAVVMFPSASLGLTDESPPVYITVHSSETAECPSGQSRFALLLLPLKHPFPMMIYFQNLSTLPELALLRILQLIMDTISSSIAHIFSRYMLTFVRQVSFTAVSIFLVSRGSP
jgi:RAB protein geranylgeranyltransferase component A